VSSHRKISLVAGVFFILTIIASIPALILFGPVLNDPNYIVGAGADTRVFWGAFLEVITVIANIGTAVTLFSILKRQDEGFALGYVATRVLEGTIMVVGIICVLSVVTLRQDFAGVAGADAASLTTAGKSLVAIKDWTFIFGPDFCAGIGNGILLGYLMYTSGLVPRRMALLGVIGGPLAVVAATGELFGLIEQASAPDFLLTLPEIAWELSLSIWLIVKGFNPSVAASEKFRLEPAQA
jgi:Domain of unknown function (DUF4386)